MLYFFSDRTVKVNKLELVEHMAEESGLSKTDSEKALSAFISVVAKGLQRGDDVTLMGFGTFLNRSSKERNGRNFKTGEVIKVPARNSVKFKASKKLNDVVNGE